MAFTPTKEQRDIQQWVDNNINFGGSLVVQAVAGSGKSSTIVWITNGLSKDVSWIMTSFGRFSVRDLKSKSIYKDNIRSYNSFGYMGVRKAYPGVIFDEEKIDKIIAGKTEDKYIKWPVKKLVSMVKNLALRNPPDDTLYSISKEYDIDLKDDEGFYDYRDRVFDLAHYCLDKSFQMKEMVDFDDQIWFPIHDENIVMPQLDLLLCDEVQDTNRAQMLMVQKAIHKDSVLIGVGDEKQSIFAFRGADDTAMPKLVKHFNADTLPLSISWRCSQAIGEWVNKTFPDMVFNVSPNAVPGAIRNIDFKNITEQAGVGDMIVSRVNAPLVPIAFKYLRRGIKVTIQGRDIGKSIVSLIRKQKAFDIQTLFRKLSDFKDKESLKFMELNKPHKVVDLEDKISTILALSEGASTPDDIIRRAESIFSDEVDGVLLSTVHRAKGLEANNVYIVRPDLFPHPKATSETDLKQESNILYVAGTRGRSDLVWVHGKE